MVLAAAWAVLTLLGTLTLGVASWGCLEIIGLKERVAKVEGYLGTQAAVVPIVGVNRTVSLTTYPAGTELNLRVAEAVDWPTTGFVADPEYPTVTVDNLWSKWLYFYMHNGLPNDTRFGGVDLPDFSHDLGLAEEAADLAGYEPPFEADDPAGLCNAIVVYAGSQ